MRYLIFVLLFIIFLNLFFISNVQIETFEQDKRCVIYNYYEKNNLYKENFIHFLENGILDDVDYYIIINGSCSVKIPDNLFVFYRDNKGADFGAYSYMVHRLKKKYDYYFFLNTSVKGPFLEKGKWYEPFIELISENVHLVGTTINISTSPEICSIYKKKVVPHVQSMFFVLDHKFLSELMSEDFFNEDKINNMTFNEIINTKEVGLSQNAISKGYNINCILSKYKNLDYINIDNDINPSSTDGDPYYINGYFNSTIKPYDVIFYKNNRF